jgi:methylmalonyl-CoA mutase C-terminal domain/subunit
MSADGRQRNRAIRCLIAKVGLDGHDRGAHVIARAFRDAGFEVVYSGLHNTPEEIVTAAVQEDVDVLGISILSGAHNTLVPKVLDGLESHGAAEDVLVLVGGTIPAEDAEELKARGVAAVFGPGTSMAEAVDFVREHAGR